MISRINNFYVLEKESEFLNRSIKGYAVEKIATFEKNRLHISCAKDDNEIVLEFNIENDFTYLLLRENFILPSKNTAYILEECCGKKISMVSLVNDDRLISIFFEDNSCLLFNLINHKQNCFYVETGIVISAYKNAKDVEGKKLSEVIQMQAADVNDERKEISKFGKDAFEIVNDLGKLKEIYNVPKYFLYKKNENIFISFFEIEKPDYEKYEYENINELLINWVKHRYKEKNFGEAKSEILSALAKKLRQAEKNVLSLKTQLQNINESYKYKLYGDKILENIWKIKKGDTVFEMPEENISIKLKEQLSPQENANNYFERYKKQKGSGALIEKKLADTEAAKMKIEEEIESVKNNEDFKNLRKLAMKEEKVRADETNKFRKFKVDTDLEVWVGKDSATNDLLTMKYSAQNDLWFHVRGFSGSHTVLKTGNKKEIDKKFILSAASIAAYYSKARNGGNVPVAYTERKYVKKKKGFKEGSVIMEKEKVIFVKPGLPENQNDS
ncbi:MAG: NFACT RNA binding domain-containing protein [Ignavibacteria bacterium]|nr:NFACT RNA binding domain-containing protein [Ignavibacteria bacterium]